VKDRVNRIVRRNKREFPKFLNFFKNIANPSYGMNQLAAKVLIDFIPQVADAGFNYIGLGIKIVIPDMFHDHCFGDDPPGVAHEVLQ
jgi:hypothetical protein